MSNLLAVEKKLIKRVLGTLHGDDLARVEGGLREAFGLWATALAEAQMRKEPGAVGATPGSRKRAIAVVPS